MPTSSAVVARARACVGARFRAQGRDPATGLDCLGLVLRALGWTGPEPDYVLGAAGLRDRLGAALGERGTIVADPGPGDVTLFLIASAGPHLGVETGAGLVHAHAGLRRVVEGPADPAWARLATYRFRGN